jgi:hypothetical protein
MIERGSSVVAFTDALLPLANKCWDSSICSRPFVNTSGLPIGHYDWLIGLPIDQ